MKKFGLATIVTSGLAAALLGLAAPAQAVVPGGGARVLDSVYGAKTGVDHLGWLDDIQPKVRVPMVDTTVKQSR